VVAEKFEAMVSLGLANTRMKDFYDVRSLSRDFPVEAASLSEAIKKTCWTTFHSTGSRTRRHRQHGSRIKIVGSLLRGISQKADCVKSDQQFFGGVAGAPPSLAVKIDQGPKSFGFAADNGDHQGKPERAGANE
jgi:hypothetical protein